MDDASRNEDLDPEFCMMLQEWLVQMASDNGRDINNVRNNPNQGIFRQETVAEFVFLVSEELQVCKETKFLAVELFDRFLCKHIMGIHEEVYRSSCSDSEKIQKWRQGLTDTHKKMEMFILSCCQVASKHVTVKEALHLTDVKAVLARLGRPFTLQDVGDSERHILKTLEFRLCFCTPHDFINIILKILGVYLQDQFPVPKYKNVALEILTVVYLKRDEIYTSLLESCQLQCSLHCDRMVLREVQEDKILMATGVIGAAVVIVDAPQLCRVQKCLYEIVGLPIGDMDSLQKCILAQICAGAS